MTKIIVTVAIVVLLAVLFFWKTSDNQRAAAENIRQGQAFLDNNANAEGVNITESGLQYLVLQEGTGSIHPGPADRVKVHYHGTLLPSSTLVGVTLCFY